MPHGQLDAIGQLADAIKNESMLEDRIGGVALHGRALETGVTVLGGRQQSHLNIGVDWAAIRAKQILATQHCLGLR